MYQFEYTRIPENAPLGYELLRAAVVERGTNLDPDKFTGEYREVLERLIENPGTVFKLEEYQLLREMAAEVSKLWSKSKDLLVYFLGGNLELKEKVLSIAREWSNYCGVTFNETRVIGDSQLRISFTGSGNWSYIGTDATRVPRNEATMNFDLRGVDANSPYFRGVVLHEFGHALGLVHEHQSPVVEIKWRKHYVYNWFSSNYGWDRAKVDRNLFSEFEKSSMRYSELDPQSIMAYYVPPDFVEAGQPTFPQNINLSDLDKKFIGTLYPKLLLS